MNNFNEKYAKLDGGRAQGKNKNAASQRSGKDRKPVCEAASDKLRVTADPEKESKVEAEE